MLKRVAFVFLLLGVAGFVASAAELTEAPGGQLNQEDPGKLPATLKPGDVIHGPATVKTAAGETLLLGNDGILVVQESDNDVELFYLKAGSLRGEIGEKTNVAVPTGWLASPKGQTVKFYARAIDSARGFVEVLDGAGVVVYKGTPGREGYPVYSFLLTTGQNIEIWSPSAGDVGFMSGQANPGEIVLAAQVTATTEVKLWIPKATAGELIQEDSGQKTLVRSEAGSWKGGQIRGEIRVSGELKDNAILGPGTFVRIDNPTGKILSFSEVKFDIIKRAISLTSEFTSVATSNFFGLGD